MEFLGSGFSSAAPELEKLKAKAPRNLTSVVTDEKVQVYKWRDNNGVMQFSSTPPPGVSNVSQVELNPNSNVVEAVKVPVKEESAAAPAELAQPGPYSVKGMKKVMEDARDVEQMLQQSHEQRSKALNNL
jgi:hypothetical protein